MKLSQLHLIKPVMLSGMESSKFTSDLQDLTLDNGLLFIKDRQSAEVCITSVSNLHFATEEKAATPMEELQARVEKVVGKKKRGPNSNKS